MGSQERDSRSLDANDAEELLASLGFLLVPGPPLDRGAAYLLVALRPHPTLAHFDPEQVLFWTSDSAGSRQVALEWPMQITEPPYAWGTIEIVDRVGATNRFVSFGGIVSIARDHDVEAALFRSDAPILSAGGHSGPADPLGGKVGAFFGVLRAVAGDDARIGAFVRECSPVALYSAFLARSLAVHDSDRMIALGGSRAMTVFQQENRRLQREAAADHEQGLTLARLVAQVPVSASGQH